MKSLPTMALACAVVGLALGQSGTQAPQPTKLQVLILTGQNTASHDWRVTTPVLRKILEDSGRFDVRVTEEFRGAGTDTLAPYHVVVVNYYESTRPNLRWGESADNALLNFVRRGKGLVLYHFSLAAFEGWREFEAMCGGNWRPSNGHHSARHDFTVTVQDRDHAITRDLRTTFVEANDELYANLKWQPAANFHVLATAWDDHSLYRQGEKQSLVGPGAAEPMLWTVHYGEGRVFATAMGHDAEAMKNAGFVVTLARGTEWAASEKVTIPVPQELQVVPRQDADGDVHKRCGWRGRCVGTGRTSLEPREATPLPAGPDVECHSNAFCSQVLARLAHGHRLAGMMVRSQKSRVRRFWSQAAAGRCASPRGARN